MADKKFMLVLIALMIVVLCGGIYVVKIFLSSPDDNPRTKSGIVIVNLPKPPPTMEREKPPEPVKEIQKKVEITAQLKEDMVDPGPDTGPQNANANAPAGPPGLTGDGPDPNNNAPVGNALGLDAEGTAGSDGFGLVGRKGGRSILAGRGGSGGIGGGGFGKQSLLNKYSWYTQIVKAEVSKKIRKYLDANGGIPRGKLKATIQLRVDDTGAVVGWQIVGSSGNDEMDNAVKKCADDMRISEPPPEGMPRTMIIRVTSQG